MADSSFHEDTDAESDEAGSRTSPGTPFWVKLFGIIGVIVVLFVVVLLLAGHGPGRHSTDAPVPTAASHA